MILVFDLDDTLYNEIDFVKGGFNEVSKFLGDKLSINNELVYIKMIKLLEANGRGSIFDDILKENKIFSKSLLKKCISIYRYHNPKIKINDDALKCIKRFKDYNKYIITDGNKLVQKNKIKSLNITKYFNKIFITHFYGIKNAKPSPYCFKKISELENVDFNQIIYIGDNPSKDFINIRQLGFKTIQLLNGPYSKLKLPSKYHADIQIKTLDEITKKLLNEF